MRSEEEEALLLDDAERRALAAYAAALAASLAELVSSPRDDAGLALLVGLARLEAVQRSLAADRLLELFETIGRSPHEPDAESRRGLFELIPFVSFDGFAREHEVARIWEEPSLRRARLAALAREENDFVVFAREPNTLRSTIYRRHDGDGWFLFFRDDRALLRLLFGAVDLVAGVAQSLMGVARAPVDGGETLRAGVAAVGDSVPELLFVNIRQGTLRYGPGVLPVPAGPEPPAT